HHALRPSFRSSTHHTYTHTHLPPIHLHTKHPPPPVNTGDQTRGRHQWLVEFDRTPDSVEEFADELDRTLRAVNSDYDAKRSHDLFLDRAEVIPAPAGLFNRWLASTGRLGGQRKVPRLSNDRIIIDALLSLIG
ncbi:MAG: GH3 auxin-responsive promoter family protein, partial [Muribaculaceae bacterium]|nr:GH3 auxin-responsive promoter family protein [Muribaculaceae bacterium]